ncbi:MAG: tetratricopeptide repeat protein [Verrucomicrobia bacterium]|nr:tetratricopeptide repeat protein [Verrucomicrobiota bacterium]
MMSFAAFLRIPSSALSRVGGLGLLALVAPALWFGPWLPFLDLVAFVGMDSYPPLQSYGPLHYATFQFTYVVHYALSRALLAFGVGAGPQVVVFYLLQAVTFYVVIWTGLRRLIPEAWLGSVALALGVLACWDGLFLWGGPLPFSLGATAVAAATALVLREAEEPERVNPLWPLLLTTVAVMCHPFAVLFALVLGGLRWILVPDRRWSAAVQMVVLGSLGWVVMRDSPESGAAAGLPALFAWPWEHGLQRLLSLFHADASLVRQLFQECPAGLQAYRVVLGALHLAGFLTAPVVLVVARDARALRFLAALTTTVALLYLCARQNDALIPGWPWRVLTFHSPFTFLAGVACPIYLVRRWRPSWLAGWAAPARGGWIVPVGIVALMVVVQVPILRRSEGIGRGLERTRTALLQSGVRNAFLVVTNIDAIQPFYLRCVPFLLFSDPLVVERNLLFYTEWHLQDRHPSRLTEGWFDLGRPTYQARFSMRDGAVHVDLVQQPPQQIALPVGNNQTERGGRPQLAVLEFIKGNRLLQAGCLRDAVLHYQAAVRHDPSLAEAHNNLGVALLNSQRAAEASDHFQRAMELRPDLVDARVNLGAVRLQAGDVAGARAQFLEALRLDPNHSGARDALQRTTPR